MIDTEDGQYTGVWFLELEESDSNSHISSLSNKIIYAIDLVVCPPEFTLAAEDTSVLYMLGDPLIQLPFINADLGSCGYSMAASGAAPQSKMYIKSEDGSDLKTFFVLTWDTSTRDGMLTIGPTESLLSVGIYKVQVVQESVQDSSLKFIRTVTVEIANNRCSEDFEPPSNNIEDEYEFEIGVDKDIVINFKDASNGNCFFESTLEIEGSTESIALYRPEILVQDVEFDQLYKKVADASLTISATSNTQAGSYDFTYTMEDKIRGIKESIKFSVEISASENTSSLTGVGGSSGGSNSSGSSGTGGSSGTSGDDVTSSDSASSSNSTSSEKSTESAVNSGSGNSTDSGNSTSSQSEDGSTSSSTDSADGTASSEDSTTSSTVSSGQSGLSADGTGTGDSESAGQESQ